MSDLHPAYIAGFIDGEGHIHNTPPHYVRIAQRDRAPLDAILESFPGGRLFFQSNRTAGCHYLHYNGDLALPLLLAVLPFLIVKHLEVQMYIEDRESSMTKYSH